MSVEFVNAYIERLIKEVEELTKTKLLLETQLYIAEKANATISEKLKALESIPAETVKKSTAKA